MSSLVVVKLLRAISLKQSFVCFPVKHTGWTCGELYEIFALKRNLVCGIPVPCSCDFFTLLKPTVTFFLIEQ